MMRIYTYEFYIQTLSLPECFIVEARKETRSGVKWNARCVVTLATSSRNASWPFVRERGWMEEHIVQEHVVHVNYTDFRQTSAL